jgi:hypothetical protein
MRAALLEVWRNQDRILDKIMKENTDARKTA